MDTVLLARLARQGLTFLGGILVAKGVITNAQVSSAIDAIITSAGAVVTIVSVGWSIYRHFRPSAAIVAHVNAAAAKEGV